MLERLKKLIEEAAKRGARTVDVTQFNHPLAAEVDWHPLKGGGSNFQTHRLDCSNPDLLTFKATKGTLLLCGIFVFIGLLGFAIPLVIFLFIQPDEWAIFLFALLFGGIFLAVGLLMYYFMTIPRVFDTFYGCYYKARKRPVHSFSFNNDDQAKHAMTHISDIKAIQVIRERISSKNGSYHSYEINLVLNDASRINVIDHGKHQAVIEDAETLALNLGVPLWDAS